MNTYIRQSFTASNLDDEDTIEEESPFCPEVVPVLVIFPLPVRHHDHNNLYKKTFNWTYGFKG